MEGLRPRYAALRVPFSHSPSLPPLRAGAGREVIRLVLTHIALKERADRRTRAAVAPSSLSAHGRSRAGSLRRRADRAGRCRVALPACRRVCAQALKSRGNRIGIGGLHTKRILDVAPGRLERARAAKKRAAERGIGRSMKHPMEVVPQGKKEQTKYGPGFRRAQKKAMERSRGIGRSQDRRPADEGGGGPLRPCPRSASRRTVESSRTQVRQTGAEQGARSPPPGRCADVAAGGDRRGENVRPEGGERPAGGGERRVGRRKSGQLSAFFRKEWARGRRVEGTYRERRTGGWRSRNSARSNPLPSTPGQGSGERTSRGEKTNAQHAALRRLPEHAEGDHYGL